MVDNNLSQRKIAEKLNVSQSTIRYWLKRFKLETNLSEGKRIKNKFNWSNNLFIDNIIKESLTKSEVMSKLGLCISGSNYRNLNKYISENNSDISHFSTNKKRSKSSPVFKKKNIYEYLKGKYKVNGQTVKKKMIEQGICEDVCSMCNQGNVWNNNPLTLQLDHIDGDRNNNIIENFRILCPNCHTQTETYSGKNLKIDSECVVCYNVFYSKYKRLTCSNTCLNKLRNKI